MIIIIFMMIFYYLIDIIIHNIYDIYDCIMWYNRKYVSISVNFIYTMCSINEIFV